MFPVCLWEIVRPLALRECNVEDQIVETTETLPAGAATDDVLATTVAHPAGTSFPRLLQALRMERLLLRRSGRVLVRTRRSMRRAFRR